MSAVNFSVRSAAGAVSHGQAHETNGLIIPFFTGSQISLNLSPQDVIGYSQSGNDLVVELASGQKVTVQGYFFDGDRDPELFLSTNGEIHYVDLGGQMGDQYLATYNPVDTSGKWSAYDEMVFLDLERVEPVVAPLVAPVLGGLGGLGTVAAGAAVVGGVVVADELLGGGGGGGPIIPTVDNPDGSVETGGPTPTPVVITGTGEGGSTVTVTVGTSTQTTVIGDDGTWEVTFNGDDLPADGVYSTVVTVVNPGGTQYDLTGPSIDIDTTAPAIDINEGTVSVGEIINAEEQVDGHVISGTGEAGASITVEINGTVQTTTVTQGGTWSVNFDSSVLSEGEYTTSVTVTATDLRGNVTTVTDQIQVDTVAPSVSMGTIEGDNIINAAEAADGVTLTGFAEVGSTLTVQFQGQTQNVTVNADGSWSLNVSASQITSGTYDSAVTLTATDAAGNSTVTDYRLQIDTEGNVSLNAPIAGDNIVNEAEAALGLNLTGTAEAGSTVVVEMMGAVRTVTADGSGNWTATFVASELPAGEYDATINVTATDLVGNATTTSTTLRVDTSTFVSVESPITGDDVINAAEQNGGVLISGTAEAGAQVEVTLHGATRLVTAGNDGSWSTAFTSADIPEGSYQTSLTVTATDLAGNSATTTSTVNVDTEIGVAIDAGLAGGDNILNASEAASGLTLTGTGEAGATLSLEFDGTTKTTTIGNDGTWSITYTAGEIRDGEYDATVTATVTDAAGNVDQATQVITVDTSTAATIGVQPATIGGDNFVNAAEMQQGLVLEGTAEPGATVSVEVEGVVRTTTADGNGNWSVTYEPGSLPRGEYQTTATVTTTDAVGNTATSSIDFFVDTEVTNPVVESVTFADDVVSAISVQNAGEEFAVNTLNSDGSITELSPTEIALGASETMLAFNPAVSDGTHLVVTAQDDAGNISDTMIVLDDNATNAGTLDHAQTGNFQIEALELDYASDSSLTLTESQIRDLSDTSDTLTIHGGSDDQVTVNGAVKTNQTETIDGEDYDVYTIGDDGVTLVIDQDINVII